MHWLIFVALGPLIGFVSVCAGNVLLGGYPYPGALLDVVMFGVPSAYLFGLIPAFVAAGAVRLLQARRVRHEWFWVSLIGTAIGLGFEVASAKLISILVGRWQGGSVSYFRQEALMVFVPACMIPTLICWILSKRLAQGTEAATS
ncbi:hypothetical protein [Microvirga calopogonii]|uniref:hypothetical protein n=1 Tax=Microvirga calopogonii TaxID=2078013 RepID=UPI000E0DAD47|nr:hypothetical protein [Microvirga calopogonii]